MSDLDLTAAIEAAARAWRDENARRFPVFATEWGDLPAATRRNDLAVMTVAVAAAALLIEAQVRAQVRAQVAAAIAALGTGHISSLAPVFDDGFTSACALAARIARGIS